MGNKLFVGGLSWGTDDDGLKKAFSEFGNVVEAKVIKDRDSGRSKGFGFVKYDGEESAQRAMDEMNETELDGRTIRVDWATEKSRDGNGGGRRDGGRGKAPRRHRDR
jgi:cold-inducible RNA-binding protein